MDGDRGAELDGEALRRLRATCATLPGAEEGALQDRPLFHVRRRRFAIFNGSTSPPRRRWAGWGRSLHVLADPDELPALLADPRFSPSPHHGSSGWLGLPLDDRVGWAEVAELLAAGHARAARSSPRP